MLSINLNPAGPHDVRRRSQTVDEAYIDIKAKSVSRRSVFQLNIRHYKLNHAPHTMKTSTALAFSALAALTSAGKSRFP